MSRGSSTRWILYKHTSSLGIISETALYLAEKGSISKSNKKNLLNSQIEAGAYKGRNRALPLDAATHRINTLRWLNIGYYAGAGESKRFVFGPLGNLFLENIDNPQKLQFIFLALLWSKQFPDDFSTDPHFKVFPFRLLFTLMSEPRLERYLTGLEYAHVVSKVDHLNGSAYDELVSDILHFRNLPTSTKSNLCKEDESHHVNGWHEWRYWRTLLSELGLMKTEPSHDTETFTLNHGKSTKRTVDFQRSTVSEKFQDFVDELNREAPFFENPISLTESGRLRSDVTKEVLSFLPKALLRALGESDSSVYSRIADLLHAVSTVSLNASKGDPDKFEELLTETMNTFIDVRAEWVGGSGMPDVSCVFTPIPEKFIVEAKSTQKKLSSLNAGRLREHRKLDGARYTVVITPAYTPAALADIAETEVAILSTSAFVEYVTNAARAGSGNYSYADLRDITLSGFGTDISPNVSALTAEKFGAGV